MRRGRALAAAALALALAALGAYSCSPSDLTPFGIGTRGPEGGGVNGAWSGQNSTGQPIDFNVGSEIVADLLTFHAAPNCITRFESGDATAIVENDAFTLEIFYTQGRLVVTGTFTSPTTCAGSYFFEALAKAQSCPTTGAASFVAAKVQ
jgi:hypothetical protein